MVGRKRTWSIVYNHCSVVWVLGISKFTNKQSCVKSLSVSHLILDIADKNQPWFSSSSPRYFPPLIFGHYSLGILQLWNLSHPVCLEQPTATYNTKYSKLVAAVCKVSQWIMSPWYIVPPDISLVNIYVPADVIHQWIVSSLVNNILHIRASELAENLSLHVVIVHQCLLTTRT